MNQNSESSKKKIKEEPLEDDSTNEDQFSHSTGHEPVKNADESEEILDNIRTNKPENQDSEEGSQEKRYEKYGEEGKKNDYSPSATLGKEETISKEEEENKHHKKFTREPVESDRRSGKENIKDKILDKFKGK